MNYTKDGNQRHAVRVEEKRRLKYTNSEPKDLPDGTVRQFG